MAIFTQNPLHICFLFLIFSQTYIRLTESQPTSTPTPTTTAGLYTKLENPFCLGFSGSTCNSCAFTSGYFLYDNQCYIFQNRRSDYFVTTPTRKILRVCDPQCDSTSCIEGSGTDKGLCTGCQNTSPTSAFYAYQTPTGVTGKYERCVTDCEYFGQYYGEVTANKGACSSCPSSCEICDSGTLCIECSYTKQRYTGSDSSLFTKQAFTGELVAPACGSRAARSTGSFSKTYYVTPQARTPSCTVSSCQGTAADPFDDINLVFQHLLDVFLMGQKEVVTVNIYLQKVQSGGTTLEHTWKEKNMALHYKRVFERVAADVTIQALTCGGSVTQACYSTDEKATVILKSNKIMFFVTKTFSFKNIIVDAAELIPNSTCFTENQETTTKCCNDNTGTFPVRSSAVLQNGNANDAQCSPKTSQDSGSLSVPWEAYSGTTDLWKKGPFAFFVMNFLRDYPKYIPTLTIEGCVFKNFWYHRYAYSFIYLDQRASKLTIKDSTFQNFYFPMGLVTNMQKMTQRNNFFTTDTISTKLNDCKSFNSSLSECQSLTVQDSTFQDTFFGDYVFTSTDTTTYANEGLVLSLHEFRGLITVKNNIFKQLASIKFSLKDSATATISSICSQPRASFANKYRLSLDRHIQLVVGKEDWTKTPRTSSVLSIRNVTSGLTLYNNTFTNNAAETGTALFVHDFANTESSPIIIEENTFTGNFATEFGTALAIVKYERDYVKLACKGVYLSKNTFQDNLGCPYVKGTAIVSCMPDKPNLSLVSVAYNQPQNPNLLAYMLGYFVSTNDINGFATTQPSNSRYTDVTPAETDDLTAEIFSKFTADITRNKDTMNSTVHPIYGTTIDLNRVTSTGNNFTGNYAYHSQLFIQGAYNTLVKDTIFSGNSVPVTLFMPQALTTNIALFKKALASATFWIVTESTPLIVRMSNSIVISGSTFTNNTQLYLDSLSLAFGAAITIDKHLGLVNVSITDCTFSDNQGWPSSNSLYSLIQNTSPTAQRIQPALEAGIQGTLITYNYWEYMYGLKIQDPTNIPRDSNGFYETKTGEPYVVFDSCVFSNNMFNVSSSSQVATPQVWTQDTRTAIVRMYSATEGISSSDEMSESSMINTKGTYVLSTYVVYDSCTFQYNTINDERSLINPYGFTSLTLSNSVFDSNTIADGTSNVYSPRALIYSYNQVGLIAAVTVQTVTFKNNIGKLMYFEDHKQVDQSRSTSQYKILLDTITIQDHQSCPDFLIHATYKQYTTISALTVNNVTSSMGLIFVDTPRQSFKIANAVVNKVNTYYVGCLLIETVDAMYNLEVNNFKCKNAIIRAPSSVSTQTQASNSQRSVSINLNQVPISACFAFSEADRINYENLTCSSASVIGYGSTSDNPSGNKKIKAACLYTQDIATISLPSFKCTFAAMESIDLNQETPYIAYFGDGLTQLTLTSVLFEGNDAEKSVYMNGGKAAIYNSNFTNNTARSAGSAFMAESNAYVEINNTVFYNNTCDDCEGTLNIQTGKLVLESTTFEYNIAESAGAVYASLATITISDSIFNLNTVESGGSAVVLELCTTKITNCTFEKNEVLGGEGTVYIYEGEVLIQECSFIKNAAHGPRNLQVLDATKLSVLNSQFIDDEDGALKNVKGSLVFVRNTKGSINGSTFVNARGGSGGAVYLNFKEESNFTFKNDVFSGCYADTQGEAIYAQGTITTVMTIEDSIFSCGTPSDDRKNRKDLSAVYCSVLTCQLDNVTFSPTGDVDSGNQLFLYKGSGHTLNQVNFTADCETLGNCDRSQSSAFRTQEVEGFTVTDSVFQGWGDTDIGHTSSIGGAVKLEFAESKAGSKEITYTFTNCQWNKNYAKYGGAISAQGVMNISLVGGDLMNNFVTDYGGAIFWNSTSTRSNFIVTGTGSFNNNSAGRNGGAYQYIGRPIDFQSTSFTFTANTAQYGNDKGSYAVYPQLVDNSDPSLYEDFVNLKKEELSISRLLTSSNEYRARLLSDSSYASGVYIEPPMVIAIYDEFGQQVLTDSRSTITVSAVDSSGNAATVDGNPFEALNGYVILYPLAVYATPGSSVTFSFTLSSFNPTAIGRSASEFTSLFTPSSQGISLRECVKGERRSDDLTCAACDSSKYTLLFNSVEQCKDCPEGGVCEGYDKFGPAENYFKLSYSTNLVVACSNDEACQGAYLDTTEEGEYYCAELNADDPTFCYTGWCKPGYQGHLCGECRDGYAYQSVDERTCTECASNPNYYLYSAGVGIAGVIYIVIMIRGAIKEEKKEEAKDKDKDKKEEAEPVTAELKDDLHDEEKGNDDIVIEQIKDKTDFESQETSKRKDSTEKKFLTPDLQDDPKAGNKDKADKEDKKEGDDNGEDASEINLPSFYMKIFTDYVQLVSIIGSFSFEWPDEITQLFDAEAQIHKSSSDIFSIDCMLRQPMFKDLGLSSFFSKLLVMAVSPIAFGVVISGVWYLVYFIKYKSKFQSHKTRLHTNIITSLVVCIFILHPTITELSTQSFKCTQLGDADDDLYLEGNLEVKCWESSHLKWAFLIGLPSLIIWGLGIPLATLFLLKRYKNELHLESMKAKFGFLYEGYFARAYYWEFVIFYRKMILIVISVFMSAYSTNIQGAIVIGISALNYILLAKVKPYLTETLNEMEKRSLIASALSIYGGLFYLSGNLGSLVKLFFFIVIIIGNAYYFIYLAVEFMRAKAEELQKNKIINKLFGRCLVFFINFQWKRPKKQNKIVPIKSEEALNLKSLDEKDFGSNVFMLGPGSPSMSPSMSPNHTATPYSDVFNKSKTFKLNIKESKMDLDKRSSSLGGTKPPVNIFTADLFSHRLMTANTNSRPKYEEEEFELWRDQREQRMSKLINSKKVTIMRASQKSLKHNSFENNENDEYKESEMVNLEQDSPKDYSPAEDHSKEGEVEKVDKPDEGWNFAKGVSMQSVQQQSVNFIDVDDYDNPLFELEHEQQEKIEEDQRKQEQEQDEQQEQQEKHEKEEQEQQEDEEQEEEKENLEKEIETEEEEQEKLVEIDAYDKPADHENSGIFKVEVEKSEKSLVHDKEEKEEGTGGTPRINEESKQDAVEELLMHQEQNEDQGKTNLISEEKNPRGTKNVNELVQRTGRRRGHKRTEEPRQSIVEEALTYEEQGEDEIKTNLIPEDKNLMEVKDADELVQRNGRRRGHRKPT